MRNELSSPSRRRCKWNLIKKHARRQARWSERAWDRQNSTRAIRRRRISPIARGCLRQTRGPAKSQNRELSTAVIGRGSVLAKMGGYASPELTLALGGGSLVSRGNAERFVNSYSPAERRAEDANWSPDSRRLLRKTHSRQPAESLSSTTSVPRDTSSDCNSIPERVARRVCYGVYNMGQEIDFLLLP